MRLSSHAAKRLQQRALPPLIVDLLQRYGRERRQAGATILYFDSRARETARAALHDTLARFDHLDDAYLIESADTGMVITVGHRISRMREK